MSTVDESVTNRNQRLNLPASRTELSSKPAEVNVDRVVVNCSSAGPHVFEQVLTGYDPVLAFNQVWNSNSRRLRFTGLPSTVTCMSPKSAIQPAVVVLVATGRPTDRLPSRHRALNSFDDGQIRRSPVHVVVRAGNRRSRTVIGSGESNSTITRGMFAVACRPLGFCRARAREPPRVRVRSRSNRTSPFRALAAPNRPRRLDAPRRTT